MSRVGFLQAQQCWHFLLVLRAQMEQQAGSGKRRRQRPAPCRQCMICRVFGTCVRHPPSASSSAALTRWEAPDMTPWGKAKYEAAKPSNGPPQQCSESHGRPGPQNMPASRHTENLLAAVSFAVRTKLRRKVIILYELRPHGASCLHRTDAPHPADITPTYMGHSIGKWDGDTLVVDNRRFSMRRPGSTGTGISTAISCTW